MLCMMYNQGAYYRDLIKVLTLQNCDADKESSRTLNLYLAVGLKPPLVFSTGSREENLDTRQRRARKKLKFLRHTGTHENILKPEFVSQYFQCGSPAKRGGILSQSSAQLSGPRT